MQIPLTRGELDLLIEALDSHEYWQLSEPAYRNDGFVRGRGADDKDAARNIRRCRALHEKLEAIKATRTRGGQ